MSPIILLSGWRPCHRSRSCSVPAVAPIACLLVAVSGGVALAGAAAAQDTHRIEVVWTTGGPAENPFRHVDGIVGSPDGMVYIVDLAAHSLYRFDPETGEYVWLEQQGQGPGELDQPYLVTLTPSGQVAVYDMGRRMILVYSPALEPQDQFPLDRFVTNPKGFAYLSDGSFIIAGSYIQTAIRGGDFFGVHRFDGSDGTVIGDYVPLPDPGKPEYRRALGYVAGGPVFGLEEGGFLYSNSAPHRILHFDRDLEPHEIASDPSVVEPIVESFLTSYFDEERQVDAIRPDWYHDQARGIFRLRDGRVLNIITRQHSGASTWELWSMAGELLERFDVDEPWRPFGITRDEDILVAYDDPDSFENVVAALRWK